LIKKFLLIFYSTIIISGCTTNKAIDTVGVPYEKVSYKVKTKFNDSINYLDKQYSFFQEQLKGIKSNILENKFAQYIIPDSVILRNRKSFITWSQGSKIDQEKIAQKILKEKHISLSYKELKLTNKLALLNDYFFEEAKKNYLKAFAIKNPRPKYNDFLTQTGNIKVFNNYKLLLDKSKHNWKINLLKTRKKVAQKALSTLYGDIIVKNIEYDISEEKLHMQIHSQYNQFSQNISISVEAEKAKKMKKFFTKLKPSIYFSFKNETLSLVGISIYFEKENYLAQLSQENFIKKNTIILLTNDTKLNTTSLNIDYKRVIKNMKPPKWFYNLPEQTDAIIGYGSGYNKENAKTDAYRDISESLEVNIKSQSSIEKSLQGDLYGSKKYSKVDIKSKNITLQGTKILQSETKDGVVYIAILYKRNKEEKK